MAVPNTYNLAKTKLDKENKYKKLANEVCAMWKQNTVQVIPIAIIYGSNSKVTITKSKKTLFAPNSVYKNAKICKSWRMFNCKELLKL